MKLSTLIKLFTEARKKAISTDADTHWNRWSEDAKAREDFINLSAKYILELTEKAEKMQRALEFYAQGGHPAMDMWQHPDLGYFTGKRARQVLAEVDK